MKQRRFHSSSDPEQGGGGCFQSHRSQWVLPRAVLFSALVALLFSTVQGQNSTQAFSTQLFQTAGNQSFDLGDVAGLTGLELNVWMLPFRSNDTDQSLTIFKFLGVISVNYDVFMNAPTSSLKHAISFTYGAKVSTCILGLTSPTQWMNVNLRVQFGSYITISVWQGIYNVETAPECTATQTNPSAFQTIAVDIQAMDPGYYMQLADIRIFELDSSRSFGQYFKYYHGVFPSNLATDFTQARQYYTSYQNVLFMDIRNANKNMSNPSGISFPVERCTYGQMIAQKTGGAGLPTQTLMNLYQCNFCQQQDCIICPANYQGMCKYCKKGSTLCSDSSQQSECPNNYFLQNGICIRCPPGCLGCTSARQCLGCNNANLVLFKNLTHSICKCTSGNYGIADFFTYNLNCQPCDTSKCLTCENSPTTCTSCNPSLGLYLYGDTCVPNCKTQLIPSYTFRPTQSCLPCGDYCLDCVNNTFCNDNQCKWNTTPGGIMAYNHNGICKTTCPDNSLPNLATKKCDDCGYKCAICNSVTTNCMVCELGFYLERTNSSFSTCMSQCPAGKYPDGGNVCQFCPSECTLCLAQTQCTQCLKYVPVSQPKMYYYVNFKCVQNCPDRYYKDSLDINNLFCRNCPSGCNQCLNENQCTVCDLGWYLDTYQLEPQITYQMVGPTNTTITTPRSTTLCVSKCQPGYFPFNGTDQWQCKSCLSNCERCDNSTHCAKCTKGFVLNVDSGVTTCIPQCQDNFYANAENECKPCITGCKTCYNNHSCDYCISPTYLKIDDTKKCVSGTCPQGYFQRSSSCLKCLPECLTCSTDSTCNTCIIGYQYQANGAKCISKCGNGAREDNEQCDDGNSDAGDGCSDLCQVEEDYVCMPLNTITGGADVCYCDAKPLSAAWTSYWGTIEISFASSLMFNTNLGQKSADAKIFCSQILDPVMMNNGNMGKDYSCFLESSPTYSAIRINVDLDATIGNKDQNYTTTVRLIDQALLVKGCPKGIPLTYTVTNLPLDTPTAYFQSSLNGGSVPKCAQYYGINIFTSKGFTKRNVQVTWVIQTMNPDDSDLKQTLQDYLDSKFTNVKYFEFLQDQIELLAGKQLKFRATVTNFLGLYRPNDTTIDFSNQKQILLLDLQDIYTFQTAVENTLAPRVRIPYCSNEDSKLQEGDLKYVQIQCWLFSADLVKRTIMPNCTIPAFNMTVGRPYKVRVNAVNLKDPNMGVTKWVHIDTLSPNARVAYIDGCNRLFSVNNSFDLEVMIPTNVSFAKFNWFCTDLSTGSPCFTTSFSYITMANTKRVTIPGGQLFSNNTYKFKVIVFDTMSQTQDTQECLMYAAILEDRVLDIAINTEANRNGFIDFNAQMAAFKVQIRSDTKSINTNNLNFTWKLTDSSGVVFQRKDLSIYQNSMGVLISKLERSNVYQVETNITVGTMKGYIKTTYQTEPAMPFEFSVEPPEGEPHKTVFTFSVTSQDTLDGLYSYVFGYFNPVDKSQQIPIYQKSTNRYQRTQLPVPEGQNYLTCYVQVMLPSGESKTYQQNVTMTYPSITVADFKAQLNSAVMDDLVESMQVKNKLVTLRSKMTLADRSFAIRQILKGLQNENTPLSDYNIQSSVASLLEFVSLETESLMSDAQIVTVASNLFQQITIGENKDTTIGRYSQFGRAATFSLYNFANNLFQKDFSNVIGGVQQLNMKVMFMQGLKNILKGSLSNQILGDIGGFSYQGQNIYVKAVKFDQLENNYRINASLPKSLGGKLIQNFVNITLPSSSSDSNPCKGKEACQVSVIILDQPTNTFLSNQKDSILMSMFVDVSLQETEVSSPYNYVQIKDLPVKDLKDPITLTIPLIKEFTDTTGNRTLGCGYLDENDQIFKADGIKGAMLNSRLMNCQAYHLTAIGVEEFTLDKQQSASADDPSLALTANTTTSILAQEQSLQIVDMWGSWAVYTTFGLLGGLILGCIWGYRRDKRDELNLKKVYLNKERIYINLYLDPLPEDQLAALENDEEDYDAIQIERARQQEMKKKRQEAVMRKNQVASKYVDENMPVRGLFSPEELQDKFGIKANEDGQANLDQVKDPNIQELLKTTTKKKKKKKKAKITEAAAEMMFEGGSQGFCTSSDEYESSQYEGGSDDEELKDEEGAQSIKPKGKKKKGKKSTKKSDTLKTKQTIDAQNIDQPMQQADTIGEFASPQKPPAGIPANDLVIDDFENASQKTKNTKRSVSKKKSLKKKATGASQGDISPLKSEEKIVVNQVNLAGFKNAQNQQNAQSQNDLEAKQVQDPAIGEGVDADAEIRSRRSKRSTGKKKKGARSSSARRQRSIEAASEGEEKQDDDLKPDYEAEEVTKKAKFGESPNHVNKEDLFKPVRELERQRLEASGAADYSPERFGVEPAGDAKTTKSKKKLKKKKTKKRKAQQDEEEEEEDDSSDEEEEKEEEQKKEREGDEDPAGCCQFCFWNFREAHRCLSFFSFYNEFMSRPTRWALLIMSWYLFMAFTGLFMAGAPIIAEKSTRPEQFVVGTITALFCRAWILITTYFLMHPKPSKIMQEIPSKTKAAREIRNNNMRYYGGLLIITISVIFGAAQAFNLSGKYTSGVVQDWGWTFLFSIIADFIVIDGLFMAVVTIITVKVGAAPDACGRKREMWLKLVPPAIKDSIE